MAATGQIRPAPSVFNFLKEGLLLPTHNRRLFATIFTIIVASSCLLRLSTDPITPEDILQLTQNTQYGTWAWALLLTRSLFDVNAIIKSAIEFVVLFAAIATYSGELHTSGSLLGKIKTRLKGPVLTLALVHALKVASVELLGAMSRLFMYLTSIKHYGLLPVVSLFVVVLPFVFIFLVYSVYFTFLWSLSVVVAVAEPGCHSTGAVGRAWRLMKGKRGRVLLFFSVTAAHSAAMIPVYILAERWELTGMAARLLLGFLDSIVTSAVELFEACAMVAFYYECNGSTKASAFLPVRSKLMLA